MSDQDPVEEDDGSSEAMIAAALGLDRATHHVLLCGGPSCCSRQQSDASWTELKVTVQELERRGRLAPESIRLSRVSCLKICRGGPILIVYPDGVWYRAASPAVCAEIVRRHLAGGQALASHAFLCNPLRGRGPADPR